MRSEQEIRADLAAAVANFRPLLTNAPSALIHLAADVPDLLAENARLREVIDSVREMHKPNFMSPHGKHYGCAECINRLDDNCRTFKALTLAAVLPVQTDRPKPGDLVRFLNNDSEWRINLDGAGTLVRGDWLPGDMETLYRTQPWEIVPPVAVELRLDSYEMTPALERANDRESYLLRGLLEFVQKRLAADDLPRPRRSGVGQ